MVLLLLSGFVITEAPAQEDPTYRMEVGVGVGAMSYLGDFNGNVFRSMQPMGGIAMRRVFNPYTALNLTASYGKLKGAARDEQTYYPEYGKDYVFSGQTAALTLTFEYNFWPYGTGKDYRGARRLTPYIYGGLGGNYVKTNKNVFTAQLPLGVGVKYKIAPHLNLSLAWGVHFTLSDELDGAKDPYGIASSGMFKNTDGYSSLQLSLTYSFSAKCPTCNKDYF